MLVLDVKHLDSSHTEKNIESSKISLNKDVFGLSPKLSIIKQVLDWQRDKYNSDNTHKTKNISEVSGTGKKPYAQKGRGAARHGSLRSVQMRGGSVVHGPRGLKRSINAPTKKIRKLALLHALSSKVLDKNLIVVENFAMDNISTNICTKFIKNIGANHSSLICLDSSYKEFLLSVRNIHGIKTIFKSGLNVYDIIKHQYFITSRCMLDQIVNHLL